MPRRPCSGTPGLFKKHARGCVAAGPTQCDCPWYGKYKQIAVNLARWSNQYVDPRRKQHAIVVLNRLFNKLQYRNEEATVPTLGAEFLAEADSEIDSLFRE